MPLTLSSLLAQIEAKEDTPELSLVYAHNVLKEFIKHHIKKTKKFPANFYDVELNWRRVDEGVQKQLRGLSFEENLSAYVFHSTAPEMPIAEGTSIKLMRSQYDFTYDIKTDSFEVKYNPNRVLGFYQKDYQLRLTDGQKELIQQWFAQMGLPEVYWTPRGEIFPYIAGGDLHAVAVLGEDLQLIKKETANLDKLIFELLLPIARVHKIKQVHRDIKPQNIMFNIELFKQGKIDQAIKLVDYRDMCETGSSINILGTAGYMPQDNLLEKATPYQDNWGAGVIVALIFFAAFKEDFFDNKDVIQECIDKINEANDEIREIILTVDWAKDDELSENMDYWVGLKDDASELKKECIEAIGESLFKLFSSENSPICQVFKTCFDPDKIDLNQTMSDLLVNVLINAQGLMEYATERLCKQNDNDSETIKTYIAALFSNHRTLSNENEKTKKQLAETIMQGLLADTPEVARKYIDEIIKMSKKEKAIDHQHMKRKREEPVTVNNKSSLTSGNDKNSFEGLMQNSIWQLATLSESLSTTGCGNNLIAILNYKK